MAAMNMDAASIQNAIGKNAGGQQPTATPHDSKIQQLRLEAGELRRLADLTEMRRIKDILSIEARKIETEIIMLQEKEGTTPTSSCNNVAPPAKRVYDVKLNTYAWDQTDSAVKVYVTLPKVETLPAENIQCTFSNTSFELKVKELESKNYILAIKQLHSSIRVDKCSWKVKSGMVVISLPKSNLNHWADLTKVEKKDSKKVPKMDDEADPAAGIMNLMKQMYDDGDDDMKRTIAKAWSESREKNMKVDF